MDQQSRGILGIVGQGYVGLPLAMAAVDAGWTVYGLDILETKVSEINRGFSPVEDVSNSQLKSALSSGAYLATCDFSLVSKASVVTICVPTPLDEKREPDLKVLRSAVSSIAPYISSDTLVISESTSYPGTLRDVIVPIVNEIKPKNSKNIFYASAPERVNPGDLVWNQGNTPRLVGGINEESQQRAIQFYESICHFVVPVSTPEIAEAAKLLENTFRLVNIALANEFTRICSASGINAHEVIDAASSKPYGFMPFRPGVGVGGHCIPVDPLYLTWWARERGEIATFVEAADSVNQAMPKYVASRAMEMIDRGVKHPRVLILGIAYKSGVGDVRETPVSQLRTHLEALGAEVAWHDPLVKVWAGSKPVDLSWDCDLAILATNQPGMNLRDIIGKGIQILDCTNSFNNQWGIVSL